ncbi:MAG: sulfatase [Candidatus Eisenbacteria bacterium]
MKPKRRSESHHESAAKALLRLLLPLVFCLAVACGVSDRPLNVVLIGVDTLRPDHMASYGYRHDTMPNTGRLAAEGVLFENTVAPSPWTLPSFATIFTSLYPTQHGAVHFRNTIRDECPTLAELLKANGYATYGVVNAPYLKAQYKLNRGFDFYNLTPIDGRNAEGTTSDALDWIDMRGNAPFFLFVHYFDPHLPYSPPAPYDTIFDPDYSGRLRNVYDPKRLPAIRLRKFDEMKAVSQDDWDHIRSLYDGEVAFTDEAVGSLLEGLEEKGLLKNTLIVFLSDHGEEFYEHDGFEHGHSLYDELLRVPLIFSLPGRLPEGVRIGRQVRLVDIAPTILDLLGLEPDPRFEGVSLKPLLTGEGSVVANKGALLPPEIAYAEAILYGTEQKSVTAYPWKFIYDMATAKRTCFNLAEDPGERNDISDAPSQSLSLLETALFRTVFNISDTWFVEMVGGYETHSFDIAVSCDVARGAGRLDLHKVILADGTLMNTEDIDNAEIGEATVEIRDLKAKDPLTLAIKLRRKDAPIQFDLKIDGEPATQRTFIGNALSRPVTMPFTDWDSVDDGDSKTEPDTRPKPPYFLIWLSKAGFKSETTMELDDETEMELRSLGYVQ